MGRIAKILSFLRVTRNTAKISDVKVDSGGGANITAEHFAPVGDDSYPLKTDYALTIGTRRSGGEAVVGYSDPLNTPKAAEGDKRIYARDPSDGSVVAEMWLKNDGSIVMTNEAGDNIINPDGSVDFANGATIDKDGDVISSTGISLNLHKHIGNLGSPTGPAIP